VQAFLKRFADGRSIAQQQVVDADADGGMGRNETECALRPRASSIWSSPIVAASDA
jgi:hypothetical protein